MERTLCRTGHMIPAARVHRHVHSHLVGQQYRIGHQKQQSDSAMYHMKKATWSGYHARRADSRICAGEDQALDVTVASAPAPDDPVISILFTLAVVALSVLTLGVGYLSLTSFLDARQEEEDRRKSGFGPSQSAKSQSSGADFDTSAFQSTKKKSSKPKKSKNGKGFGS
jgi:hypothetical protein